MKDYILEACVDSVDSAVIATRAGASRLEFCANLMIGGTTPTLASFREVKKHSDIPVHVLLRPRFGDFLYTESEFTVLKEEVRAFREEGAEGIVIGMLTPDGDLDEERLRELISLAGEMHLTLHRAFDVSRDGISTLEAAIRLGFHTVLTSGRKNTCTEGIPFLKELNDRSAGRINILAGSGADASNMEKIHKATGITQFHMSGKTVTESLMKFRRTEVSMGLPICDEYAIWRTDPQKIADAVRVLECL